MSHEIEIAVEAADIDALGHVNNVVYVRWVQDAAVSHWRAEAPAADQERLVWVVVRHEIDYKGAAQAGDRIIARTWVGEIKGLRYERFTDLRRASDGKQLAAARTLWCPLDRLTRRPVVLTGTVRERFSTEGVS